MAFEKHEWTCGETITADLLNRMEDGIEEAMQSGGGDCGYECTEGWASIFNGNVTTAYYDPEYTEGGADAELTGVFIESVENPPTIKVTFNGTEYTCEPLDGECEYGAPWQDDALDWSEYPFHAILTSEITGSLSMFYTENEGTYSVKIEAWESSVETSECFDKARGYSCTEANTVLTEESVTTEARPVGAGATLSYSQPIEADSIKLTVNGTEYVLEKKDLGLNGVGYGGFNDMGMPDFSVYPIGIASNNGTNSVLTETAGTYSVKIEAWESSVETSECFDKAVKKSAPITWLIGGQRYDFEEIATSTNLMYFVVGGDKCHIITDKSNLSTLGFIPSSAEYTAGFESNGVFRIANK